jgi:hypothetical protein
MTSTVITDEIREIGRKALGVFWDDAPARQIGLAADTFLEVVAPMILEAAAKAIQAAIPDASNTRDPEALMQELAAQDARDKALAAIRALRQDAK